MPEKYVRKINKIPKFLHNFCLKNAHISEFYIIIAQKVFFQNFRGTCPLPPSPKPMRSGVIMATVAMLAEQDRQKNRTRV